MDAKEGKKASAKGEASSSAPGADGDTSMAEAEACISSSPREKFEEFVGQPTGETLSKSPTPSSPLSKLGVL